MLRIKYSHQRASDMYQQGRQYYRSFLLYHLDEQRRILNGADMHKLIGAVLLVAGAAFNGLLYLASDGETYVIFYGLLVAGLIWLIRAISAQRQAEANLDRLTEKLRLSEQTETVAAP